MTRYIVAIKDAALEAYGDPVTVPHLGVAIRSFTDEMRANGEMAKHPEDYDLYHIGTYYPETAEIMSVAPTRLVRGLDAMKETSNVS